MAHESANPKVRTMVIVAIVSAVTLGILDQIFKSYFNMMMEEEEYVKVSGVLPKQLNELRAAEQTRLTSSPLPIDRAMKELATRGREAEALKDLSKTDITPQPSNDTGALVGWGQLAKDAGAAAAPAPAPAPMPEPAAVGDAGVATSADAGAPKLGDAGAALPTTTADAGAKPTTAPAAHADAGMTTAPPPAPKQPPSPKPAPESP